jgi:hypothetical protein
LTLSYLNGEPIPEVARHFVQVLNAGYEIGSEGWAALSYHGQGTIDRMELLRFASSRNIRDTMMFLNVLTPQELATPEVMNILIPHLRDGDARAAQVVASAYASKRVAAEVVFPLICARLGDEDLESERFLYILSRYQFSDAKNFHFILMAFNDPRERMRAAAYEVLAWHAEMFPHTRQLAQSLIASRLQESGTKARTSALWSYQHLQRLGSYSPASGTSSFFPPPSDPLDPPDPADLPDIAPEDQPGK